MGDSHMFRNNGRKRPNEEEDPSGKKQKNRDAASRSREKKKKETQDLKTKNQELVNTNKELTQKKRELERKLQECMEEINRHKSSGCNMPEKVAAILASNEFSNHEDFVPVGTQTIPNMSAIDKQTSYKVEVQETEALTPQNQTIIKGLFSGNEFLANTVEQGRKRNLSSNSSSRSPPPQVSTQSQPPLAIGDNISRTQAPNPSWTRLHQKTCGVENVSVLSPAQTVPNIDSDQYTNTKPDTLPKYNGYPDIEEAVQCAQRERGIEEIDYLEEPGEGSSFSSALQFLGEKNSLSSTGFTPMTTPSVSVSSFSFSSQSPQNQSGFDQSTLQSSKSLDLLKPSSSGSMTCSMNHTAELLSQAMFNFEPSEISEDLKKEIVRVTNNQDVKEVSVNTLRDQFFIKDSHFVNGGIDANGTEENNFTYPLQVESSVNSNSSMTLDGLLELARKQEQGITLQIQGAEYNCDFETFKQILAQLKQNSLQKSNAMSFSQVHNPEPAMNEGMVDPFIQFSQASPVVFDALQESPTEAGNQMLNQGVVYMTEKCFSNFNQGMESVVAQQIAEVPVQTNHLPTTVLSMIEEDTIARSGPSTEMSSDSVDYGENVKDLPSLSLTEDHTNIFEKKRGLK